MIEIKKKPPYKNYIKVLAVIFIIIGIGVTLYLLFGSVSDSRDDDASFNEIEQNAQANPVVLFFWGEGCSPCQEQKPIITDLEEDYKDSNVTFYWFKYSNHKDLTEHYDITGIPTTIVLNHSGRVKTFVGLDDYGAISTAINDAIQSYS